MAYWDGSFVATEEEGRIAEGMDNHERFIRKTLIGAAAIGSVIGLLAGSMIPVHRNVTETTTRKVITIKQTKLVADPKAVVVPVVPDTCLGGKRGFLVKIGVTVYAQRSKELPEGTIDYTFATFRDNNGINFTCVFKGVDGTKFWDTGTYIVAQGGERI